MSEDMNWLEMEEKNEKPEVGDVVEGEVVQVTDKEAYVLVKGLDKQEIPITKDQLANPAPESAKDVVKVGDIIEVKVMSIGGENGGVLSKVKADEEVAWKELEGIDERKEIVEAKIIKAVKGGLIAIAKGVRAFIPASQIDFRFVKDLNQFIGQTVMAEAIEVDVKKHNLKLSRRNVIEAEKKKKQEELFATLEPEQIIKGTVKRIVDYGAFIDIGGIDGLAHISDLSWGRIKHPSAVLNVGEEIDVFVKAFDKETGRVSLSVKDAMPDPWFEHAERYTEGSEIQGKIVKLTSFGAFMEIEPGFDGLIPMGELANKMINKADEVVQVGQVVTVKILQINKERKRISLSITKAESNKKAIAAAVAAAEVASSEETSAE